MATVASRRERASASTGSSAAHRAISQALRHGEVDGAAPSSGSFTRPSGDGARLSPGRPIDVATVAPVGEPEGFGRGSAREPLRCPNDGSRLVEVERSDILIDACPECRGVWLDRGELDKILVRERQLASSDPDEDFFRDVEGRRRREPEREPHDDYPSRKRRRRGLLEDLLDFD